MATRQYIGARYIPVFADPVEWDNTRTYEPLTMVQHLGETYITRQSVPIGVQLPDTGQGEESNEFWVHMSNWNAQVEAYRQEVLLYNGRISDLENGLPVSDFDSVNTVKAALDGIQDQIGTGFDDTDNITAVIGSGFDATDTVALAISSEQSARENQGAIRPIEFATVSDMKASSDIAINMIVKTAGFRIAGDGGGATYAIIGTGTANEMDVIACGDLFAVMVNDGININVDMLGAYGNGIDDDYPVIQYAIDNFKHIEFTNGKTYVIETGLEVSSNNYTINGNDAKIKTTATHAITLVGTIAFVYIENFVITNSSSSAIYAPDGIRYCRLRNIQIRGCNAGFNFSGVNFVNRVENFNAFEMGAGSIASATGSIDLQVVNASGEGYSSFINCTNLGLYNCAIDNGGPSYSFHNSSAVMVGCSTETYRYAVNAVDNSIVTIIGGDYEGHISTGASFSGWFKASGGSRIIARTNLRFDTYGGTDPAFNDLFEISSGFIDFEGRVDVSYDYNVCSSSRANYKFDLLTPSMVRQVFNLNKTYARNFSVPIGVGGYRQNVIVLFEGAIGNYDLYGAISGKVEVNYYNSQWNLVSDMDVVGYAAGGGNLDSLKPTFSVDGNNNLVATLNGFAKYDLDFKVFKYNFT